MVMSSWSNRLKMSAVGPSAEVRGGLIPAGCLLRFACGLEELPQYQYSMQFRYYQCPNVIRMRFSFVLCPNMMFVCFLSGIGGTPILPGHLIAAFG